MTIFSVRLATACAALTALLAAACGTGSTDKAGGAKARHVRELRVLDTRSATEVAPFADRVEQVSRGRLRLAVVDKWERGSASSDVDAVRAIRAYRADLAVGPVRAWNTVGVDDFDALIAPLEIDSMALQQKVLASAIPAHMLTGVTRVGLDGIGILPGPMRLPAGITRPLLGSTSYAGARIAFNPSAVAEHSLRALGATPVESGFEGAAISADDGIEQQATSIAGNRYDSVVRTVTVNVDLWPRPLVIVANARAFATLSHQERDWLRSAARDALEATTKLQMDQSDLAPMCRRGDVDFVNATMAQLSQLRAAFAPVYAWLRADKATARYLDEIDRLKTGVEPYPQEAPSCEGVNAGTPPPPRASKPSPLDGSYRMVTTETESRASDPNTPPENWGTWIFVFGRGRFAFTQANSMACTWGYGTFVVHGSQMEWTIFDGGGISPTGAVNKPGEHFVYEWSKYRDQLTLAAVAGELSPDNFLLEPWQQLSSAPSASYLSKRCPPPSNALPR